MKKIIVKIVPALYGFDIDSEGPELKALIKTLLDHHRYMHPYSTARPVSTQLFSIRYSRSLTFRTL